MAYKYITNRNSPNYTVNRAGRKISEIDIHWWGDPATNPSTGGVVNWLCNPASQVSAHYVVSGTNRECYHLVNDKDTAWHAGNLEANYRSIGLELDPRCRPEDYDVAAEVIADLWKVYGKLPLVPHRNYVATACPGNYDLNHLYSLAEQKLNPKPTPPPQPVTKPVPASKKLPKKLEFTAKLAKTEVWDLTTNPNYKSVKTLKGGEKFTAYAQIDFNEQIYYVTEYSHSKGNKHGINARDLTPVPVPEPPKPVEPPKPTEPEVPPVTELPDYPKENNALLKQILALLQSLVDKITSIFK